MNIDRALAIIAHGESNSLKDLSEAGQLMVKRLEMTEAELQKERERLDWVLIHQAAFVGNLLMWVFNDRSKASRTNNPRQAIDELMGK